MDALTARNSQVEQELAGAKGQLEQDKWSFETTLRAKEKDLEEKNKLVMYIPL